MRWASWLQLTSRSEPLCMRRTLSGLLSTPWGTRWSWDHQIICDSNGNILSVEKCCVGSTFEQDLWNPSFKGREMEDELHGHYWVIGGSGYNLSKHVLTPVLEPANEKESRFNQAHAKIYNVMRTTLGSTKRRFRCLMQLCKKALWTKSPTSSRRAAFCTTSLRSSPSLPRL